MSLFEFFSEQFDPGPTGKVEWQSPEASGARPRTILLHAALAIAVCSAVLWWAYDPAEPWPSLRNAAAALAVYLLVCALVSPQPDDTNLGWLGGLFDNPFRWSDDYNRWLVFLLIVITPGRIVVAALLDVTRLVWARRAIRRPPSEQ